MTSLGIAIGFYALAGLSIGASLLVFFTRSLVMLFVALGLVQWLTMARIVRGQVMALKSQEFVLAARATGVPAVLGAAGLAQASMPARSIASCSSSRPSSD